jgi:hypothetical protein
MVESSEWLSAPALAAWVRQQPEAARLDKRSLEVDRLRKWRNGGVVSVYTADRWLVRMGICLLDVPEWLAAERPGGRG